MKNIKGGPKDFNFSPDDTPVVRAFKKSKTYMWFRKPIEDPNSIYNNWEEMQNV